MGYKSKYTQEERLSIGKEIYEKKLTKYTAAAKYDINPYTARDYLRMYRAELEVNGLDAEDAEESVSSN